MAKKVVNFKGNPRGVIEVVDNDAQVLSKAWRYCDDKKSSGSAYYMIQRNATAEEKRNGAKAVVKLHREIWEVHNGPVPADMVVDHIDFNTLNNRIDNLQLVPRTKDPRRQGKADKEITRKFQAQQLEEALRVNTEEVKNG